MTTNVTIEGHAWLSNRIVKIFRHYYIAGHHDDKPFTVHDITFLLNTQTLPYIANNILSWIFYLECE